MKTKCSSRLVWSPSSHSPSFYSFEVAFAFSFIFLWIFKCQSSRPLPLTFQHLISQNTVPYLWQLHHVHLLEIEQNKSLSALKYVHGKNKIFLSVRLLQFLFLVLALSVFFHIVPQPNCSRGITRGKILWIRKYQSCVTRGAAFTAVLCFKIPSLLSQSTHLGKVQLFLSQNSCMEVPLCEIWQWLQKNPPGQAPAPS